MRLKNVLVSAFMALTLIPIIAVSLLLYKSGYELSKGSYLRNLKESISVQTDYIVQTIDNNMVFDYRFSQQCADLLQADNFDVQNNRLYTAFQSYLEVLGDKVTVCLLLDEDNNAFYSIGQESALETVNKSLPSFFQLERQTVIEFELELGKYSLAIATPIWDKDNTYLGCLVSVYDQAYLFKIISSYYKIADTSTYICRENGDIINYRAVDSIQQNLAISDTLGKTAFDAEGEITSFSNANPISGYYKKIGYTPWYLVGFIDNTLISAFTNQYVIAYIFIILIVAIADMFLAISFSRKVVEPINSLIRMMEGYPDTISNTDLEFLKTNGYFETRYLSTKFSELTRRILLVQHNFEGVYQLYQSGNMSDTNINIDTIAQTISSNKTVFQTLMNKLQLPPEACIVERFTNCFCEKDQHKLMDIFVNMRDFHLSVPCELDVYTPHWDEKWFHVLVAPMYENDRLSHLFIQLRDVSSFKKQELESSEKAIRDSLTGLYNRSGFTQNVNRILLTEDQKSFHGFLFIDMDYFKMVNDNFGHIEGDNLLRSVGDVLLAFIDTSNIISRFGGDEFAVFLPNTSPEIIAKLKDTLQKQLIYPFEAKDISFVVTASIGVSTCNGNSSNTFEDLLRQADADMYQTKKRIKHL